MKSKEFRTAPQPQPQNAEQAEGPLRQPPAFQMQASPVQMERRPGSRRTRRTTQPPAAPEPILSDANRTPANHTPAEQSAPAQEEVIASGLQQQNTLQAPADQAAWEEFATRFSQVFQRVLPDLDGTLTAAPAPATPTVAEAPSAESQTPVANAAPAQRPAAAARPNSRGRGGNRRGTAAPSTAAAPSTQAQAHAPASNLRISAQVLRRLFTVRQRNLLTEYMRTQMIPPHLFSGGTNLPNLTGPRRMALSAHILAHGYHNRGEAVPRQQGQAPQPVEQLQSSMPEAPQSEQNASMPQSQTRENQSSAATGPQAGGQLAGTPRTQRVHAQYCGNWAYLVLQYAGLAPRTGPQGGPETNFGINGEMIIGNTTLQSNSGTDGRVNSRNLPGQENGSVGPIHGAQLDEFLRVNKVYHERLRAWEALPPDVRATTPRPVSPESRYGRHSQVPWDQVMNINLGDWLWIYNANPDVNGSHSMIFQRWVGPAYTIQVAGRPVRVRRALGYSQHSHDSGGVPETVHIGEQYAEGQCVPVARIYRADENVNSSFSLLPAVRGRNGSEGPVAQNAAYIRRVGQGQNFDTARFLGDLRAHNHRRIDRLADRENATSSGSVGPNSIMTREQLVHMETDNTSNDLLDMVMLFQRLVQIEENSGIRAARVERDIVRPDGLNDQIRRFNAAQSAPRPRGRGGNAGPQSHPVVPYALSQPTSGGQHSGVMVTGKLEDLEAQRRLSPLVAALPALRGYFSGRQ